MMEVDQYCQDLVREQAWDHYIASLFMPDDKRPHALALYAFDAEIARIRNVVSEPQLGLIRQQWWLDTLDAIYAGEEPDHPAGAALAIAVRAARLPQEAMRNMVLAREFDLHADPMPDLEALETYLGQTSAALIQLVTLVLAGDEAAMSAEAAGLAGVAIGLARLLQERPLRHLPPDMTDEEAALHARRRLEEARRLRLAISSPALPAFLPASLTGLYLRHHRPSQFRRQIAMWWAAKGERF